MSQLYYLSAAFTLLNFTDALMTILAVSNGKREGNPLMGALIAHNPVVFLQVKLLVGIGVVLYAVARNRKPVLLLGCAMLALVLLWNGFAVTRP